MKECKTCLITKPLTEFYKHSAMADGHINHCKECKRKKQLEIRNNNLEYYQEYDRNRPNQEERTQKTIARGKTEEGKAIKNKAMSAYKDKYPIKYKATRAVGNAVRDNRLIKPTICENCNTEKDKRLIHGHHSDYSKPLEVMWLCHKCHVEWHLHNKPLNGDKGLY